MTTDEISKLMESKRIHWGIKSFMLENYVSTQNQIANMEQVAYRINLATDSVFEYLRLANFARNYPTLLKVQSKREALEIIDTFHDKPVELRARINFIRARYKSRIAMDQIKRKALAIEGLEEEGNAKSG